MTSARVSGHRVGVAALMAAAGCAADPGGDPMPRGAPERFEAAIQPILEGCANPACHGDPGRPLALYAPGMRRADPRRLYLPEALTARELDANRRRVEGLLAGFERAADAPLLTRALALDAGGTEHAGGTFWVDREEPDYLELLLWSQDAIDAAEVP